MLILRDTVAILQPSNVSEDDHGNVTVDWDSIAEQLSPAQVNPLSTTENLAAQDTVTTRWRVFLPAVGAGDRFSRIRWRGDLFDVDGDIEVHTDLRGRPHHRELLIVKHDG